MTARIGSYLLPGDPVWLRSSLRRYYDHLDALVVLVPVPATGWTGHPLPVEECLRIIAEVDVRGMARIVKGHWEDRESPIRADTAQRQAGLDALEGQVDWVLQIDNDELLSDAAALIRVVDGLPDEVVGVEWPLRVLYRRLSQRTFAAVCGTSGAPVYEYPGAVLVRPGVRLADARRPGEGRIVRHVVEGDAESFQVRQVLGAGESRIDDVSPDDVILHNSWGRSTREILRKTRSWGHASGWRGLVYVLTRWWTARWVWRWQRDLHPFARGLWPRLGRVVVPDEMLDPADR